MKSYLLALTATKGPAAWGLATMAALLLAGCGGGSGTMDAGERMSARGASITGRGAEWSDGQRAVTEGQKLLDRSGKRMSDGEKKLREAQEQIDRARRERQSAERQIADGTEQMRRAEADYTDIRTRPSVLPQ